MEVKHKHTLLALEYANTINNQLIDNIPYNVVEHLNAENLIERTENELVAYHITDKGKSMLKVSKALDSMTDDSERSVFKMLELYTERFGYSSELTQKYTMRTGRALKLKNKASM